MPRRTVTEIDEFTGKVRSGKMPKRAKLISWSAGPQTRGQKVRRALWG